MRNKDPRVTWLVRGVRACSLGLSVCQPALSHGPHTASAPNPKTHYLPPLHVPGSCLWYSPGSSRLWRLLPFRLPSRRDLLLPFPWEPRELARTRLP